MLVSIIGALPPYRAILIKTVTHLFPHVRIKLLNSYPAAIFTEHDISLTLVSYTIFEKFFTKAKGSIKTHSVFIFDCPTQEAVVRVIEFGAHDAIMSPFNSKLFTIRVQRLLSSIIPPPTLIQTLSFSLNPSTFEISTSYITLQLRPKEYHLLSYLVQHKSKIVTRSQLLHQLWQEHNEVMHNTIDTHIKNIRKHLKLLSIKAHIKSIYGMGYKFEELTSGVYTKGPTT